MLNLKPLLLVLGCALSAAPPPAETVPAPPLLAGEDLALAGKDGEPFLFGETQRESPMGNLAYVVWLKLEAADWCSVNPGFKCAGVMNGEACSVAKGHGRVDLASALQVGCDLAFLNWARISAVGWKKDYGEGAARARLEEVFRPFLGGRMPPGEGIPALTAPWVGDGALLRTSPARMLAWLTEPNQEELLRLVRRLTLNFIKESFEETAWWIMVASAPVPVEPGAYSTWAIGGNGSMVAVLRLPVGTGRAQAMARFRAVLALPKAKK